MALNETWVAAGYSLRAISCSGPFYNHSFLCILLPLCELLYTTRPSLLEGLESQTKINKSSPKLFLLGIFAIATIELFVHRSLPFYQSLATGYGLGRGQGDRHLSLDRGPASRQDTSNESFAGHRNSQLGEETLVPQWEMGTQLNRTAAILPAGPYCHSFQTRQFNKAIKKGSQAQHLLQALTPGTCSLLMPAVLKVRENPGI